LLFQSSTIPKVHCADTRHSANVWINVRVRVIGLGSALGLDLGLVGIDFRNSGPLE